MIPRIIKKAQDVFLMHPFDEKRGLWKRVNVNGDHLTVDNVFNHQLWFAASAGLLEDYAADEEISGRLHIFMNNMEANLALYPSGLIVHQLRRRDPKERARQPMRIFYNLSQRKIVLKAVGYHQFNLYAFALLKSTFPDHAFRQSRKFQKLWKYANSGGYEKKLFGSEYGYPYNPAGFEMAYALEIFDTGMNKRDQQKKWVTEQIRLCLDFKSGLMTKGTQDAETHAARIYEAVRLPDMEIDL